MNSEEEGVPGPSLADGISSVAVLASREDGDKNGDASGVASGAMRAEVVRKGVVGGSVRAVGKRDLVGWRGGLMEGEHDECDALNEDEKQDNCRL
jgi:hypothetical protein